MLRHRAAWELGVGSWELSGEALHRQHVKIFAHTLRQADEDRIADEGVADRDFVEMRQPAEQHEVVEIEVVPGVHAEAKRMRELRRARVERERLPRVRLVALERPRERLGI